jgi:hypothetical protein
MTETTKKKKEMSTYYGGLEGTLDSSAFTVLLMSLFIGIGALAIGRQEGILTAVFIWFIAFIARLFLKALAESLRLQKKALGLPYGGEISEAHETVMFSCSECEAILHSETRCESCGRTIEGTA